MPELPEVESAVRRLRRAIAGRTIGRVRTHHPAHARRLPARAARSLAGRQIAGVTRRGKHQFVALSDGRVLHVHFRMSGDWLIDRHSDPLPRHARVSIDLTDGARAVLIDPRALSTVSVVSQAEIDALPLGPEPADPALTARSLAGALASRHGAIKATLLDQRVIAGLGNIYAAESLWTAGIDPRLPAHSLGARRLARLLSAIRAVLKRASGSRRIAEEDLFAVYDREGEGCRRCSASIRRITQAGRSTFYCPRCQRR